MRFVLDSTAQNAHILARSPETALSAGQASRSDSEED